MKMMKTFNTLALCLCIGALTACSSARGESAGTTTLDATAEECAGKDTDCCAEMVEVKAKDSCCMEEAAAPSDS